MVSHIEKLPVEILHDIFQRVRNSSTHSELCDFGDLLSCCRLWHGIAKPLFWTDVVLSNENLPLFLRNAKKADLSMVHSLTIYLTPVAMWSTEAKIVMLSGKEIRLARNPDAIWSRLQELVEMIPRMSKMTSFSFSVPHTNFDLPDHERTWLRYSTVENMLKNLPASCTSLEVDTSGQKERYSDQPKRHICHTLGNILPRMKHVRLSLGMMCYSVFESSKRVPTPMPLLETFIINLHCGSLRNSFKDSVRAENCDPAIFYSMLAHPREERDLSPHTFQQRFITMLESAIKVNAYPKATRISVFDMDEEYQLGRSYYDMHSRCSALAQIQLQEHDLLAKTVTKMPYIISKGIPKYDFLRYVNSNGKSEVSIGRWRNLTALAENHAWEATASGSRLNHAFAASEKAWDEGYVFERKRGINRPDRQYEVVVHQHRHLEMALEGRGLHRTAPTDTVEILDKETGLIRKI